MELHLVAQGNLLKFENKGISITVALNTLVSVSHDDPVSTQTQMTEIHSISFALLNFYEYVSMMEMYLFN